MTELMENAKCKVHDVTKDCSFVYNVAKVAAYKKIVLSLLVQAMDGIGLQLTIYFPNQLI